MVHGAAKGLAASAALGATTTALAILPLRTVLLLVTATATLSATPTAEVAAPATSIALLAAWLLRGRAGGNRSSVTGGLWWGRKIRLFREVRFVVVHYFLRYGGQVAEILRREAALKIQMRLGFKNRPCPENLVYSTHERGYINF
jgi:hypothetical protein